MKLLKVLVAALLLAAMVTPAVAEDRLSLYGELRVRAHYYDYDLESGQAGNGTIAAEDSDDSAAWNDSRFRLGGKIAVAEGVNVHFRMDAIESNENSSDPAAWGSTNPGSAYRYTQRRGDIQFDKAYLDVKLGDLTINAGQMYFGGMGYTRAFHDSTAAGFSLAYKGFKLQHSKNAEENLGNETLALNSLGGDSSTTGLHYTYKGEGFGLTPMVAYTNDDTIFNQDVLGVGLAFNTKLGPVALKGEFDYFDGEQDGTYSGTAVDNFVADERDIKGMQLFLDGSMAVSDTVTLGLQALWADSVDANELDGTVGDEKQMTSMTQDFRTDWAFVDFMPQNLNETDFAINDNFDIFDPGKFHGSSGAGSQAVVLYADVKATEDLGLKFGGSYFTTDDDDIAEMDGYFLNAVATYKLAENTTFKAHAIYQSIDNDDFKGTGVSTSDDAFGLLSGLYVKF